MKFLQSRPRARPSWERRGTVVVDRDGYEIYDLNGKKTSEFKTGKNTSSSDLRGADSMTDAHFKNFIAGIRSGEKLTAPIAVGKRIRDHPAAFETSPGKSTAS